MPGNFTVNIMDNSQVFHAYAAASGYSDMLTSAEEYS